MDPAGFNLLYEEGPCLVVAKPGGLLTQAPPGIDSLEVRVKRFLQLRDQHPGRVYLGVPHRLDRPVSGAVLLARHVRAARRLCEQFEGRTVEKVYWALVEGLVDESEGVWSDYLRKLPGEARGEVTAEHIEGARPAVLRFRILQRLPQSSWLEIRLETGRFHQIRLQCASRGHPVLGDELYGSTQPFGPPTPESRDRWIALHARMISFRHPMTRQRISVTAPLSDVWPDLGVAPTTGIADVVSRKDFPEL